MNNDVSPKSNRLTRIWLPLAALIVCLGAAAWHRETLKGYWDDHFHSGEDDSTGHSATRKQVEKKPMFELVKGKANTIRLKGRDLASLGINVYTIGDTPPTTKLRLPGTLTLDPNRFVRVHSRFPGEVRRIGEAPGRNRPLQFGDTVTVGQLLFTIWSKDIGEKKSELVDALTREHFDKIILDRLISVEKSVVTQRAINDADRNYQSDKVAVSKAERTLRSWNFTQKEIDAVHQEAEDFLAQRESISDDAHWAELDILAAQSGVIIEKNTNVGDMIDINVDLMKIADIDRLQVLANVFEEDLPALRRLSPSERNWSLQLRTETSDAPLRGQFDQISIIVDPDMHTSSVMGYVDNSKRQVAIGQFITATIELPGDPGQVVIPVPAVIEEGSTTAVFVETNAELQEYTRRRIAVVSRGMTFIHVAIEPDQLHAARGAQPLHPGERVLINSVVELDAVVSDLASSAAKH